MRAFHIALLSLAASTAAPVFAAPIPYVVHLYGPGCGKNPAEHLPILNLNSYLNARSDVLSARGSNDSCIENKSQPENLTAMQLSKLPATTFSKSPDYTISTRDSMTDSMTAVAKMNAREPDVVERNVPRDVTHGSLAARATRKEMLAALLSDRSESSGQGIQARGFFSDLFDIGTTIMTDAAEDLIRDVSPDELHPRGDSKDVVEMPNTRELSFKRGHVSPRPLDPASFWRGSCIN